VTKIDFRRGFAKLRLRREQSVLARFAEPQQLKAIKDGLTLGKKRGRWVVPLYVPLASFLLAEVESAYKSIFRRDS
jgi:hypothetical protein